jgi:hypothetical protein
MSPAGIERATFRHVKPCLNQLHHRKKKKYIEEDVIIDEQAFEEVQNFRYLGAFIDSTYKKNQ